MKKYLLIIILIFLTNMSHAASNQGTITLFNLDSNIAGRGLCIQMTPSIPVSGWACLYNTNSLYKEITSLLLAGYAASKTCTVYWTNTDADGLSIITRSECI